jgi:ribosomal protein S17
MTVLVAKLNNKIVEIVRVAETVQFSKEKDWILISHQISKRDSLQVKWLQASKVKFDWVKEFRL